MKIQFETRPDQDAAIPTWLARWNIGRGGLPVPELNQFIIDRSLENIDANIAAVVKKKREDIKELIETLDSAKLAAVSDAIAAEVKGGAEAVKGG